MGISVWLLISQHRVLMEELSHSKKDFEEIIKAKDRELKETKVLNRKFIVVEDIYGSDLARRLPVPPWRSCCLVSWESLVLPLQKQRTSNLLTISLLLIWAELEGETNSEPHVLSGACFWCLLLLSKIPVFHFIVNVPHVCNFLIPWHLLALCFYRRRRRRQERKRRRLWARWMTYWRMSYSVLSALNTLLR